MKAIKFLLGLGLMVASSSVFSQGLQGIVVEKYYQANQADVDAVAGTVPALTTSSVTYRIYADMAPGYRFNSMFALTGQPLSVSSTLPFYNDGSYSYAVPPNASSTNIRKSTAMLDSWFTIATAASGQVGIPKSLDVAGTVGNADNILANPLGGACFGFPLNGTGARDGFTAQIAANGSTPANFGTVATDGIPAALIAALEGGSGTSLTINDGYISVLLGVIGDPTDNKVLLGQFTTAGELSFSINVQIQEIATGSAETYYANPANAGQLSHPTLIYVPNQAPTATLTSVTNVTGSNANILTGTTMTLTATASDFGTGTVTGVEFFVNGTSVGTDATADANGVYSVTHVASVTGTYASAATGAYVVTAKATDNECAQGAASTQTFPRTIAANVAPTVTLSAPTSAVASSTAPNVASVTFTATPTDNDGVSTISQVEFFVNNVSVGIDNVGPTYSFVYSAPIENGQVVKAVATDNLTLTGTSSTVTLNVIANVPPTVSITYPTPTTALAAPNAITITATASDAQGNLTGVEFFVNGNSIGIDSDVTDGTFSRTWTVSTPGIKSLTAKATDGNNGSTTSAAISVDISDPNALPYKVKAVTQVCENTTFCVPIATGKNSNGTDYVVDNVRGYDFIINYDALDVVPTGAITIGTLTSAPTQHSTSFSANGSVGTLNLSLYFDGAAPVNSEFAGTGDILCVQFARINSGFSPYDSSAVSVATLNESYITGVQTKLVTANKMYSITQDNYVATLQYWNGTDPIQYNSASPATYLLTSIQGILASTNLLGTTSGVDAVVPNTSGVFTHLLTRVIVDTDGAGPIVASRTSVPNIAIKRDILNTSNVSSQTLFTTLVNSFDAAIVKTILTNEQINLGTLAVPVLGNPTVYHMIAADVNLDGKVSAGDLSQMQQRSVGALQEYQQAWNYNIDGTPNNLGASKDWLFIDQSSLTNNPAYQISNNYPFAGSGTSAVTGYIGYWKNNVPVVPFYLPVNVTGYNANQSTCPTVATGTIYKGIMLGELSGNYAGIAANGITKTNETDYILVDLSNVIVEGTKVSVPVSIVSAEPVTAFDLALLVNENTLTYVSQEDVQLGSETAVFYNSDEKALRHSSFNLNSFTSNARVAYFTFETADGKITEKDLTAELGLLNEKQTEVRFTKSTDLVNNTVDIYPNPSNGNFSVTSKVDGRVDIVDVTGKLVHPGVVVKANQMIEVNMPELSAGVYFVRVYSNNSMTTERIVISE